MFTERRAARRECLSLQLVIGGGRTVVVRDVSATGLFLLLGGVSRVPRWHKVQLDLSVSHLRYCAWAEVVRVEYGSACTGVALRLARPQQLLLLDTRTPWLDQP